MPGGDEMRLQEEDRDTGRLVARFKAGEERAFDLLYLRYFDRVFAYLLVALPTREDAQDATQEVFARVFQGLPGYERREQPFRAWLFTIVRHRAISALRALEPAVPIDPAELDRYREELQAAEQAHEELEPGSLGALGWITDPELMMFVERMPLPQRQVLALRYLFDMPAAESAATLGRSEEDVRVLQHRALGFLRDRLEAIGRIPRKGDAAGMARWSKQAPVLRWRRWALYK